MTNSVRSLAARRCPPRGLHRLWQGHRLWRRIGHYANAARSKDDMSQVRSAAFKADAKAVSEALGELEPKSRRSLTWAMRSHHERWDKRHVQAMYALQRTRLKAARAWRMKTALRQVYEAAAQAQSEGVAKAGLKQWISWASRSRLDPFKRLAKTLKTHWDGVVAGMLQARTNAYVEAMNGLLQQAKRAARGFRNTENFIAIAYLRMSKLAHLPTSPFEAAKPSCKGRIVRFA